MTRHPCHPTREKILDAAADLMWRQGYRNTSPAQVMRSSGVGQGSFYHHFPDKRALGLAVVERLVHGIHAGLAEIFRPEVPPLQRLRDWLDFVSTRFRPPCDRGCPLGTLGVEMTHAEPLFRERIAEGFQAIRSRLQETFAEARDRGEIAASVDPSGAAEMLLAGLEGAILVSQCEESAALMDRVVEELHRWIDARAVHSPGPSAARADGR